MQALTAASDAHVAAVDAAADDVTAALERSRADAAADNQASLEQQQQELLHDKVGPCWLIESKLVLVLNAPTISSLEA